jgi:predicted RNA-binding Zn-ribbon protein involved in translation (DUF1610 family)
VSEPTTVFKSICPACGDIEFTLDALILDMRQMVYEFRCPSCSEIVTRPANHRIVWVMLASGCLVRDDVAPPDVERFAMGLRTMRTIEDLEAL